MLKVITADELEKKVEAKESVFILDVRNEEAFAEGHLEVDSFTVINKPYMDLLDGVEPILAQLPDEEEIVVVCVREPTSILVGEMLVEAGRKVSYLTGGMTGWHARKK